MFTMYKLEDNDVREHVKCVMSGSVFKFPEGNDMGDTLGTGS